MRYQGNRFSEFLVTLLTIGVGMSFYLLIAGLFSAEAAFAQAFRIWLLYCLLPWVALLPLLLGLLHWRSRQHQSVLEQILFAPGLVVALGLSHLALIALGMYLYASGTLAGAWSEAGRILAGDGILLFDIVVFVALAARADRQNARRQLHQKDEAAYTLNRSLSASKLQSLVMQLNPHFLFNTLNGLAVLIDKRENEAAREMVGELGGFLRQVLRSHREKWVTLDEELEFIRQYLRIEQYRFGKRLARFEDCEPLALAARIPPMLLQPLFENAIVHGLADKQGECRLGFECRLYDRHLIMMIFDNGDNFDEMQDPLGKGGIGLSNVQERLREVYGDNFALGIEKKPDGTLVTLKVPAFKDSQF
ncbi:MAG: sensor histidine kinase [Gammaproteobacteria bacterium]